MSLSSEPIKREDALLRMIDEGIAALQTDEAFTLTVNAIKEFSDRDEKKSGE